MDASITFHARKPTGHQSSTHVVIELWKNLHVLGVWLLTKEDAQGLAVELAQASLRPGESLIPLEKMG